jgi:hypothetical protein
MDFTTEEKMICALVLIINIFFMIGISSWFYIQILRHRGKIGHNSVDVNVDEQPPQVNGPGLFLVENLHQELSGIENIEMANFNDLQRQAEIKKQQSEIDSAILSLKTNMSLIIVLILLLLSVMFLSSDALAVVFTLVKSQGLVVICIINFGKIRALVMNLFSSRIF